MVKIMENPIKIDDLGVPLFLETPTNGCTSRKHSDLNLSVHYTLIATQLPIKFIS